MRSYVLQLRWVPWHVLWAVILAGCLGMAYWQWDVATSPHPAGAPVQTWRNYAYALNWVIFAGVAVWFWWRYMRDQRAAEARPTPAAADAPADPARPEPAAQPPAPSRMLDYDIFGATSAADEADGRESDRRR
ncbi:MAG: hypothetical protein ACH36H_05995 [Candidatus Nanopelagicales bacterium]